MASIPPVAARQFGVFSPDQALAAGWTERQLQRRLAAARWKIVVGRGLAQADRTIGGWQLAQAVHLTWPDAVVSHQLAGVLWGFPLGLPKTATVILTRDLKRKRAGLVAVRRRLLPGQVSRLHGIPVTDVARTALDLLAEQPWDDARSLYAWLSTHGRLNHAELAVWTATRTATAGTAQLRRLLRLSVNGSLSAAEDRFHELIRSAGLTGWRANAQIVLGGRVVAVVDVLFEAKRVVVEIDGWGTHSGRSAFQRDRSRQNALVAAGFVVLRFTWADLTERPEHVVMLVRHALGLV